MFDIQVFSFSFHEFDRFHELHNRSTHFVIQFISKKVFFFWFDSKLESFENSILLTPVWQILSLLTVDEKPRLYKRLYAIIICIKAVKT